MVNNFSAKSLCVVGMDSTISNIDVVSKRLQLLFCLNKYDICDAPPIVSVLYVKIVPVLNLADRLSNQTLVPFELMHGFESVDQLVFLVHVRGTLSYEYSKLMNGTTCYG